MASTGKDSNDGGLVGLTNKVEASDVSILKNGKETYEVGDVKVLISDKAAADFITGLEQDNNPSVIIDQHQEALAKNTKANKGFMNTTPLSDTAQDFFNRQDQTTKETIIPEIKSAFDIGTSKEGGMIERKLGQKIGQDQDKVTGKSAEPGLKIEDSKNGGVTGQELSQQIDNTNNENSKPYIPEGKFMRSAKEIAMNGDGMIDKKYSELPANKEDISTVHVNSKEEKGIENKPELTMPERLDKINTTLESLNELRAKSPNDPDLKYQVDRLLTNLSVTAEAMIKEIDSRPIQSNNGTENEDSSVIPISTQDIIEGEVISTSDENTSKTNPQVQQEVELTPEQKSQILGKRIEELRATDRTQRDLTNDEIIELFRLEKEKAQIDEAIGRVEQERQEKLNKRMKWVRLVSGAAGVGLAFATPGVSAAAAIIASIGGRMVGKGLRKWSNNLREKSSDLKYADPRGKTPEEIAEMQAKQERNDKWADRLEYAASAVTAFGTGFGLGELAQGIFGAAQQALGGSKAVAEGSASVGNPTQNIASSNTGSGDAGIGGTTSQATETVSRASISPSETGLMITTGVMPVVSILQA